MKVLDVIFYRGSSRIESDFYEFELPHDPDTLIRFTEFAKQLVGNVIVYQITKDRDPYVTFERRPRFVRFNNQADATLFKLSF